MAYPQQHPSATAPVRKPKWTGIIWSIVIFVVTAIVGIVMIVIGVTTIVGAINDFKVVSVPGESTVQLGNGEQWIFVGSADSRRVDASDVDVVVLDPSGDPVPVRLDSSQSANNNNNDFESLGRFDADVEGRYTIQTSGPTAAEVRVGKIPFAKIGLLIGAGIGIGAVGFLVALIILIVALVRRSRAKKAMNSSSNWGPPQPPGAAPYGQPGPQQYGQPGPQQYGPPGGQQWGGPPPPS